MAVYFEKLCIKETCQNDVREATVICLTCTTAGQGFYLCKDCYSAHREQAVNRDHHIYTICKQHPNSTGLNLYCRTCQIAICAECQINKHQACDVTELTLQASCCREKLRETFANLEQLQAMGKAPGINFGAIKDNCHLEFNDAIRKCNDIIAHVENLKQQVFEIYDGVMTTITENERAVHEYNAWQQDIQMTKTDCGDLLERNDHQVSQWTRTVLRDEADLVNNRRELPKIQYSDFMLNAKVNCSLEAITVTKENDISMKKFAIKTTKENDILIKKFADMTSLPDNRLVVCDMHRRTLACVDSQGQMYWTWTPDDVRRTVAKVQYIRGADKLVVITQNMNLSQNKDTHVMFLTLNGEHPTRFAAHVTMPIAVTEGDGVICVYCMQDRLVYLFDYEGLERLRFDVGDWFTHMTYMPGSDTLMLSNVFTDRLQALSSRGEPRWWYDELGSRRGQVNPPVGMCIAPAVHGVPQPVRACEVPCRECVRYYMSSVCF